jgi:inhibitor of KinA sporulation pathway (predicted exonuclease)
MHYIVFDLEWNIAGRANPVDAATQAAMPFEIIEIGAVKLDDQFRIVGEFSTQVRPKIYRILSSHIAAVTRRFQQSLKFGLSFPDAARSFLAWCTAEGDDYVLCTWSEGDTAVLRSNLAFHGFDDRLVTRCIDVQYVFDDLVEQAGIQRSIEYAVDFLRLPKNEPFHQAVKDAYYTGLILGETAGIAAQEHQLTDLAGQYAYDPNLTRSAKQTLEPAQSHDEVLTRLVSSNLVCPACDRPLQPLADWSREGNRADARFSCADHGAVSGKARFRTREKQVMTDLVLRLEKNGLRPAKDNPS